MIIDSRKILCKIVPIAFEAAARGVISFCYYCFERGRKKKSVFSPKQVAAVLFVNACHPISTTLNQHFEFKPTMLVDKWSGNGRN